MTDRPQRPKVRVRFKYNVDTGEIEEFIIDDNAPDRSESYHDQVARAFADPLGRHPEIEDAGRIRHRDRTAAEPGILRPGTEDMGEGQEQLED